MGIGAKPPFTHCQQRFPVGCKRASGDAEWAQPVEDTCHRVLVNRVRRHKFGNIRFERELIKRKCAPALVKCQHCRGIRGKSECSTRGDPGVKLSHTSGRGIARVLIVGLSSSVTRFVEPRERFERKRDLSPDHQETGNALPAIHARGQGERDCPNCGCLGRNLFADLPITPRSRSHQPSVCVEECEGQAIKFRLDRIARDLWTWTCHANTAIKCHEAIAVKYVRQTEQRRRVPCFPEAR